MTGRHRKPSRWRTNKLVRIAVTGAFAVTLPAVILSIVDTSVPDAHADNLHMHKVADQAPGNPAFLAAIAAAGINVTGRENVLEMVASTGAASHTTDADLEQSVRALFPDITQVQAEKFVFQVRQTWPGSHEVDTDDDGR